jgi:hypothetical protein
VASKETIIALRSIRAVMQRELDAAKERERTQNPQHAKLTRGTIIGLTKAWSIVNQHVLDAER